MAFEQIPIGESSNISAVFHDPTTQTLRVHFKKGGVYTYDGVDADKAQGFSTAPSPGNYFYGFIRGQHTHTKIG